MRLNSQENKRMREGVPLEELRSAICLSRSRADVESGTNWTWESWSRLWIRLTPAMQHVVYLHVIVGLPLSDVAAQLGIARQAASMTYLRSLGRIRDSIPSE